MLEPAWRRIPTVEVDITPHLNSYAFREGARMSERMVVIRSFSNEFNAEFARAELEAAGIPVQLLSDGLSGVHPHLQFARGIRLAVPESEAEAALELLDTPAEPSDQGETSGE